MNGRSPNSRKHLRQNISKWLPLLSNLSEGLDTMRLADACLTKVTGTPVAHRSFYMVLLIVSVGGIKATGESAGQMSGEIT